MVLFKDLNKTSTDLLTRDFAHGRPWDIEFKHSAKNPVFTQNAFVNGNGVFDALSTAKYTSQSGSLEAKLGTSSTNLEAQYKINYVPGLTLGAKFDRVFHAKGSSDVAELSVDYLAAKGIHCWLGVQPLVPSWTVCALAGIPCNGNGTARIGGELTGSADLRKLRYAIGGSFSQSTKDLTYTASFRTNHANGNSLGRLTTNIYAKTNRPGASEYGVQVCHTLADSRTNVSFVGLWPIDYQPGNGPIKTFLKAKVTHDGHFVSSLTHRVSDSLTATLGANIDGTKGIATPDCVKYGLKLNVSA